MLYLPADIPYGLKWEVDFAAPMPRLTGEPDISAIEDIVRHALRLQQEEACTIDRLSRGTFNKVYIVSTSRGEYIFRVGLPLHMPYKSLSDAATSQWVREHTLAYVPDIIRQHPTNDNILKFPWQLMEYVKGRTLDAAWRTMTWDEKAAAVVYLAELQAELFEHRFPLIGSLYFGPQSTSWTDRVVAVGLLSLLGIPLSWALTGLFLFVIAEAHPRHTLGRIVNQGFMNDDSPVHRGPYRTSLEWMTARMNATRYRIAHAERNSDNDEPREDDIPVYRAWSPNSYDDPHNSITNVISRFIAVLPRVFPPHTGDQGYVLFNEDLHEGNVIVGDDGKVCAVLDWEYTCVVPIGVACRLPRLLEGPDRDGEPDRSTYDPYDPDAEDMDDPDRWVDEPPVDNEGMSQCYWDHLLQWEKTKLRGVFLDAMNRLQPAWLDAHHRLRLQREGDQVAAQLENGRIWSWVILKWLGRVERGEATDGILDGKDTDSESA